MGIWEMSAGQLIVAGGPIMYPIILCSIFALGIVIEKLMYFSSIKIDTQAFKLQLFDLMKKNKIQDAIKHCDNSKSDRKSVV